MVASVLSDLCHHFLALTFLERLDEFFLSMVLDLWTDACLLFCYGSVLSDYLVLLAL